MSHDNLMAYYQVNFTMMFDYQKEMNFFDNAIPFEKSIYLDMLMARVREKEIRNSQGMGSIPTKAEFE